MRASNRPLPPFILFLCWQVLRNFESNETFVLYLCGTPMPDVMAIPDMSLPASTKMFEIPVKTIATAETVSLNFMEHLDLEEVGHNVLSYAQTCLLSLQ